MTRFLADTQFVRFRIEALAELQRLGDLPMLEILSVNDNPVTKKKGYRANVISWMSSTLMILDGDPLSREEKHSNLMHSAMSGGYLPDIHVKTNSKEELYW